MGGEREEFNNPRYRGGAVPMRAIRAAAGGWTVELQVVMDVELPDGRTVRVFRRARLRGEQIGRKKMSIRFVSRKRHRT